MLKIKNNSQSPKISLEDIRSSLNMKRVSNIKEENFSYRSIILPKKIVSNSSNESLIFKKKKSPIKTISYINNDTGKMRHFTPAAQE